MKVICDIPPRARRDLGEACFSELIRVYPDGNWDDHSFQLKLPRDDPRVDQVLSILQRYDWHPWEYDGDRPLYPKMFTLHFFRKYSAADRNASKYLTMFPRSWTMMYNLPDGRIGFSASETNHKADFVGDKQGHRSLLVPDRVKHELERAQLRHLCFEPAVPLSRDWPTPEPPILKQNPERLGQWWVPTSDLILPPLAPSCDVRIAPDRKGSRGTEPRFPKKPGDPPYVYLCEGRFVYPELHYRASDLEQMPAFDAALSHEISGNTFVGPSRRLIVSNRFYKVCHALSFRVSWIPVRLE